MTIDINDPKLTAYALNELDHAERAEVAALLDASPEASEMVAEIQRTASLPMEHRGPSRAGPGARYSEILSLMAIFAIRKGS